MLKQISILSAIAITLAAVAPTAEAGGMRRNWTRWGNPPAPAPAPVVPARNVTQTSVVNNNNSAENVIVGNTGCNKCGKAAASEITGGNQTNATTITQTAGGGVVKQASEVNNNNSTLNLVVGSGSIKAGNQSNSTTVTQSAP